MARVPNTRRQIAANSSVYMVKDIEATNVHLTESDTGITRLKTEPTNAFDARKIDDYESQLNTESARAINKAGQMLLWYANDLGIPAPVAYTDAEVDAIDPDIRTHED